MVGDQLVHLEAGQCATGRKAIASSTKLTEQNVRTALVKLEKLGILTISPRNKFSIISITNWSSYQGPDKKVTSKEPAANQQLTSRLTTNNNLNNNNKTTSEKKAANQKKKNYDPDDMKLARFIHKKLLRDNEGMKEPNFDNWANDIRLARTSDKRTHKGLQDTFIWANNNDFWKPNILSPSKLRSKYDTLTARINSETNQTEEPQQSVRGQVDFSQQDN